MSMPCANHSRLCGYLDVNSGGDFGSVTITGLTTPSLTKETTAFPLPMAGAIRFQLRMMIVVIEVRMIVQQRGRIAFHGSCHTWSDRLKSLFRRN